MKRLTALILIAVLFFALAGCGAPALPTVSGPAQESSSETATESVPAADDGTEAAAPEATSVEPTPVLAREIIEVEITTDNFFEYFEFVEFPKDTLTIETNPDGEMSRIISPSAFYLKAGYTVAEERADDCRVEAHVKYARNTFYYADKAIKIDLESCSYELLKNVPNAYLPEASVAHNETLVGTYENGQYFVYLGYDTVLNVTTAKLIQNLKLLSASGTLYLYG